MEFDEFYRATYARIYRAMTLSFRDPALAEEVTQEAFYRALTRWSHVSLLARPDAWTMVTALNRGRDLARRRRRHAAKAPLLATGEDAAPGESRVDDQMAVMTLLAGVTDRQRQALVLRFIAQLTVPEIAEVMRCAEGTVKSTLHAALARASKTQRGLADVPD